MMKASMATKCIDHIPPLVRFFREHRGQPLPSAALMSPMTRRFVAKLEDFVARHGIALVQFRPGQRKDAVMAEHLRQFGRDEWIVRRSAMVNNYYIYAVDRDFGPFFLKFCSYFPFNAKLCLNGHEYAKRQLAQKSIAFEALDNGILSCADPKRLQTICDGLSAAKSTLCCVNGCGSCRTPSRRRTVKS